jgi:rSAM/selenodomain-associated transferase 1
MSESPRDILYVAAKAPRERVSKTRLGREVGHGVAVGLYRAFLRDLSARFSGAPFPVGWYVTPPDAWADLAPLVDGHGEPRVLFQGDGDWTERQRDLFRGAVERGEERTVLVASDSPQLDVGVVQEAFRALEEHELVFGPTHDGGYYLIGMRGWHDVLHDIPMSTNTVLDDIAARARASGLSVGWVETTFDVDEAEDLNHLRGLVTRRADLAATRAALEEFGLLRSGDGRPGG